MTNHAPFPKTGLVRLHQIIGNPKKGIPGVIPVSRATWYEWVRRGRVPQPIKLGPNTSAWRAEDVWRLIEQLEGNQDAA